MDDTARDAILRLLRAQEEAVASGDSAALVGAMSGDVVTFDLPPPLQSRGAAARDTDALDQWFASWEGGVTVEMPDPQILVDGDLAVVFGLSRMRGTKAGDGPMDSWHRRTTVLRRIGGDWRIVHDHASFPMLMDGSGKAAVDLTP